jgi:hypothetical protein
MLTGDWSAITLTGWTIIKFTSGAGQSQNVGEGNITLYIATWRPDLDMVDRLLSGDVNDVELELTKE